MDTKICANKYCFTSFTPTEDPRQKYCTSLCKKREDSRKHKERKSGSFYEEMLIRDFAVLISEFVSNGTRTPSEIDYDTARRFVKVIKLRYSLEETK